MTKTQENLLRAFTGESIARNKYTTFAKIARKEGQEWVARIFEETADNEKAHAEELFEMIEGPIEIQTDVNIKTFAKTIDNLKMAAEGEKYEWTTMYPDFEEQAKQDGAAEPTRLFGNLKNVEKEHEERYIIIANKMDSNTLFSSETEWSWKCVNCGNIHVGKQPPTTCPVCKKPFTWYYPLGLIK